MMKGLSIGYIGDQQVIEIWYQITTIAVTLDDGSVSTDPSDQITGWIAGIIANYNGEGTKYFSTLSGNTVTVGSDADPELHIRANPDVSSDILGDLPVGAVVTFLQEKDIYSGTTGGGGGGTNTGGVSKGVVTGTVKITSATKAKSNFLKKNKWWIIVGSILVVSAGIAYCVTKGKKEKPFKPSGKIVLAK